MLEQIRIVLVGTSHTGNIGSVARAMKTMGLSKLVLVSPMIGLTRFARFAGVASWPVVFPAFAKAASAKAMPPTCGSATCVTRPVSRRAFAK